MTHIKPLLHRQKLVTEIVSDDYRAADVFRKYGIEFCCGGKWPLETVCMIKGLEPDALLEELRLATRTIQISPSLPFHQWNVDFTIDYILNVHHHYLLTTLPVLGEALADFVQEHLKKDIRLPELQVTFNKLEEDMLPHIREEEEIVFPYIRQLAHAYEDRDSYASLMVKTLRKPIAKMMDAEHESVTGILQTLRELSDDYTPPQKACTSHRVIFSKLKELDGDLLQHMYLENDILFPKALAMEKELLKG